MCLTFKNCINFCNFYPTAPHLHTSTPSPHKQYFQQFWKLTIYVWAMKQTNILTNNKPQSRHSSYANSGWMLTNKLNSKCLAMLTNQWMDVIRLDRYSSFPSFPFRFLGSFYCQDISLLLDWKLLVCYGIWNGFTFCGFDTITKVKSEWAWWTSSLLKILNKSSQKYNCSLIAYVTA